MSNNTSKEVTPKEGHEVNINYEEGTITQGGIFEQTHEMFFKRVLQQSAKLIKELSE
jgi:hypothetical protein